MEQVTLGDIYGLLAFVAGFIGSATAIGAFVMKKIRKNLEVALEPTNKKIDTLSSRLSDVDLSNCKNYLVQSITSLQAGQTMDSVALQRFWENYDHYTQLGGNSYVHEAVERLKKEGKL